jgi:iron complex outermembrane receptor protein
VQGGITRATAPRSSQCRQGREPEGRRRAASAGYRYQDFTNRSGDSGGVQPAKVQGMPRSVVLSGGYDYTRPLGEVADFYSFGTYAWRKARANENPRQPGWFSDAVDAIYPNGFTRRKL